MWSTHVLQKFAAFQVHCNNASSGEGTSAGEDIHMVSPGTTTLHKIQDRDERQDQDSGQWHTKHCHSLLETWPVRCN
jgi:hypothetical protein